MGTEEKIFGAAIAAWVFGVLLTIAFWGVVVWAIVKLVTHYT